MPKTFPMKHLILTSLIAILLGFLAFQVDKVDLANPVARLRTEIIVKAPIADVWDAVVDLPSWREWNRFEVMKGFDVPKVEEMTKAQTGSIELAPLGNGMNLTFPLVLDEVSHIRHYIQWTGGARVALYAIHSWQLTALNEHETRVVDEELLWRLAAYLGISGKDNTLHKGMLEGLKNYVEANVAATKVKDAEQFETEISTENEVSAESAAEL
ncbi:hypothetical protein BC830DRAFT_1173191 [Chytriomyces sp. MP71]|nr:hypothetical protein BC830DRAFT_1173191 [Chytriomyces sp. MP71]